MRKPAVILFIAAFSLLAAACGPVAGPASQPGPTQAVGDAVLQPDQAPQGEQERETPAPPPAAGAADDPSQQPISNIPRLTVTQTVEGSNFNRPSYTVAEGITALALLKETHQVQTKDYGELGEFVLSIDGIEPDSRRFWQFLVNGQPSNVGAGSYRLNEGDKIEWKLSLIQ